MQPLHTHIAGKSLVKDSGEEATVDDTVVTTECATKVQDNCF